MSRCKVASHDPFSLQSPAQCAGLQIGFPTDCQRRKQTLPKISTAALARCKICGMPCARFHRMPTARPDPIDDRTPLMLAACSGNLCSLFDLILSGAEIDKQNSRRWTALMYACWFNQYEIVQQLLDSGADPNIHKSYDMVETPLSIAAHQGHFEIARLLIAHGADPTCYAGVPAVRAECYARWSGHLDVSRFLLEQEDKYQKDQLSSGG